MLNLEHLHNDSNIESLSTLSYVFLAFHLILYFTSKVNSFIAQILTKIYLVL